MDDTRTIDIIVYIHNIQSRNLVCRSNDGPMIKANSVDWIESYNQAVNHVKLGSKAVIGWRRIRVQIWAIIFTIPSPF